MGEPSSQFSLTASEERFFVRFFLRRAMPYAAAAGATLGAVAAVTIGFVVARPTAEADLDGVLQQVQLERAFELDALRAELSQLSEASGAQTEDSDAFSGRIEAFEKKLKNFESELTKLDRKYAKRLKGLQGTASSAEPDPAVERRIFNLEARMNREEVAQQNLSKDLLGRVHKLEQTVFGTP